MAAAARIASIVGSYESIEPQVSNFFKRYRNLGPRERHTLAETAYTVLRERHRLSHLAQSGQGALERRLSILAWQGQGAFLAGALGPNEKQWLAGIQQIDMSTLPEKQRHNLPDWLVQPLKDQLGEEFWPMVASLNGQAPLDLRVNTFKMKREEALQE